VGKVRVLIEGSKVQEMGYRIFLLEKALRNDIKNIYVQNINEDSVELLLDDNEEKINNYYQVINQEKPKEAVVKSITKEPYSGDAPVSPIEKYFQLLTLEQLSKGREEIVKLPSFVGYSLEKVATALSGIDSKFGEVINRFGLFGQQAVGMAGKLDKVDSKLGGMDEKLSGMDEKLGNIDDNLKMLPERIAEAISDNKKK
jgi:acylphosphatase